MPTYTYKGRDASGSVVQGEMESADSGTIANQLLKDYITPISIALKQAKANSGANISKAATSDAPVNLLKINIFPEKIQTIDLMMFSRQMYTMLKAGIPIITALNGLQESTANRRFAGIIGELKQSLNNGVQLSAAIAEHEALFSTFYVNMIKVGESTGMLETIFSRLADHLAFEKFMGDQIKAGLRYPSFVIIAMGLAIVIVNIFVIPTFAKFFASSGAELPLMTQILLGFSHFMVTCWPYLLVGFAGIYWAVKTYINTKTGRYKWDKAKLKLPIAGTIINKATMGRFARSSALSSKSGVPMTVGLKLVAKTTDNDYIQEKIEQICEGVERGESLLINAKRTGAFNPIVLQMIAVGEETGALDDLLQEIADMYEQEVEYEIKALGAKIEPILIVVIGALVLVLALGIFLPIWDMGKVTIHK